MALKLAACAALVVVVVLALTMAQPAAAAEDVCECSCRCVTGCQSKASSSCGNTCDSIQKVCDTCQAGEWKKCATTCYARDCDVAGVATECPLMTTLCRVCGTTCAAPCNDIDQFPCVGDCELSSGTAPSKECDSCKARAREKCAATCQEIICVLGLSCPRV